MKHIINIFILLCFVVSFSTAGNYVIINQVMYDSPWNEKVTIRPYSHGEYIELYNAGTADVSLEGWTLLGDGATEKITLPSGLTISAQGYLVIAYRYSQTPEYQLSDLFAVPTDSNFQIYYQSKIVLSNSGESITLKDATGMVVDSLYYHGTSNKSNPNRLHAENADSIMGSECVSLHRIEVEFDEFGNTIHSTSKWTTDYVTFCAHLLPQTVYKEEYITDNQPLPNGANYTVSITPLDATNRISYTDGKLSVSNNIRTNTTVTYYDGLGRPYETIALAQSPNKKDWVSMTGYTGLNRTTHQWLPIIEDNSGQPISPTDFSEKAIASYGDNHPYHETLYENSALNRVIGATRPGDSYAYHPSTQTYEINTTDDNVRLFRVEDTNSEETKLKCESNGYSDYTLYKSTMADEDGKSITTFTDKLGRVILERQNNNDTYYVYDNKGQLCYVLPPLAANQISTGIYNDSIDILKQYAYIYRYDERGNQIYKRLPGCEPTLMVYDKSNALVLSQTGNQRARGTYWTVYKYDSLRRLIYTAEVKVGSNDHEGQIKDFSQWLVTERFSTDEQLYPMSNTGYSRSFYDSQPIKLLTVNYYDDYQFLSFIADTMQSRMAFEAFSDNNDTASAKGLLTGTRTYYLTGAEGYTETVFYYDYRGREIQRRTTNHLGGYDVVSTQYDFVNNITDTWSSQSTNNGLTTTEHYHYEYDHANRLLTTTYTFNNEPPIELQSYHYDELGRVRSRHIHSGSDSVAFNYDIRNQVTQIKSSGYEQKYYYNQSCPIAPDFSGGLYNGNISATTWTYGNQTNGYVYHYDKMNRLESNYSILNGSLNVDCLYSESFSYDAQGNVTNLTRWDNNNLMNYLQLTYDGNQLVNVDDNGFGSYEYATKQYHDNNTEGDDFAYDANGNMIYDQDRGIATICYNLLNLPDTIQFTNGNMIIHRYDAAGTRLETKYLTKKIATTVPLEEVVETPVHPQFFYITRDAFHNNIVYTANNTDAYGIEFVHNPEGYIRYLTAEEHYHFYYIKDLLGNIRETYVHPETGYKECIQRTQYYPSGLPWAEAMVPAEQPWKYNSKEFVEMHGLDEYDSKARWYYPAICRTTTMDPLAEDYYRISPYGWCENNPIRYLDLTGKSTHINEDGDVVAVYDDNDLNIYQHSNDKLEEWGDVYINPLTTDDAKIIGQSLHLLSFADQNAFNSTGKVIHNDTMRIDVGSTTLGDIIADVISKNPSLLMYALNAKTGGMWDLKAHYAAGSILYGNVYASPRDAGNFLAGAIKAESGLLAPIVQFGYGAYNLSDNSVPVTALITIGTARVITSSPLLGAMLAQIIMRGEDNLTQKSINAGYQHYKK